MNMTEKKLELNDDCNIKITLPNNQWNVIVDWLAHSPFQEAKDTLNVLNQQIQARNQQDQMATSFQGELPIKVFNMLIFALGQAPYYVVAEIIQAIYTQGQQEIAKLREQANTMPVQEQPAPVEKTTQSPDNTNKEQTPSTMTTKSKPARKRRTTKKSE